MARFGLARSGMVWYGKVWKGRVMHGSKSLQRCRDLLNIKIMKKIYKAKKGASFGDKDAQIIGKRINKIIEKNKLKEISSKELLEDAKNPESPIHKYFDWNNTEAAEKYRLYQARLIINHIEITITTPSQKEIPVRAFLNIKNKDDNSKRVYVTIEKALSEEDLRIQILKQALSEIKNWQRKYSIYTELSVIFNAIDETKNNL